MKSPELSTGFIGSRSLRYDGLSWLNLYSSELKVSHSYFFVKFLLDSPESIWYFIAHVETTYSSAPSPSGKAEVCNTFIPSSNLGGASTKQVRVSAASG